MQTAMPLLLPTQRFPGYAGEYPYLEQAIEEVPLRQRHRIYGPPSLQPVEGFERSGGGYGRSVIAAYGPNTPLWDETPYGHSVIWERRTEIPRKTAPTDSAKAQLGRTFPYTAKIQNFQAPSISEITSLIGGGGAMSHG